MKTSTPHNDCPACHSKQIDRSLHLFNRITFHPSVFSKVSLGAQCQGCGHYIEDTHIQKQTSFRYSQGLQGKDVAFDPFLNPREMIRTFKDS